MQNKDIGKQAAALAALDLIEEGMLVGLGTGSTTSYFIQNLGKRCRQGLKIKAVATSQKSFELASKERIPLIDPSEISSIDITVDGADEVDAQKRMIKGGGGALLREKITASVSDMTVIIVDESKVVKRLGRFPLAVEISPFASQAIVQRLEAQGYQGALRKKNPHAFYVTDSGHYIFDIQFASSLLCPEEEDRRIKSVVGVIETGFFFNLASKVIIGYNEGKTGILTG